MYKHITLTYSESKVITFNEQQINVTQLYLTKECLPNTA